MTDTLTFTVPDHLQRAVADLIRELQGLTETQLHELAAQQRDQVPIQESQLISGRLVWDDPINGVWNAVNDLRVAEHNERIDAIQRMEADLAGGHLVTAGIGNELEKFAAICDPNPPGKFCWEGPDRDTLEEAVEDGRGHHPGHEPEVPDRLRP